MLPCYVFIRLLIYVLIDFILVSPGQPLITGIPSEIVEHATLTFNCSSSGGNPSPTLTWYRDDVLVDQSKTSQGSNPTLVWKSYTFNVLFRDRQLDYKCTANNTYSTVSNKKSIQIVYGTIGQIQMTTHI